MNRPQIGHQFDPLLFNYSKQPSISVLPKTLHTVHLLTHLAYLVDIHKSKTNIVNQ